MKLFTPWNIQVSLICAKFHHNYFLHWIIFNTYNANRNSNFFVNMNLTTSTFQFFSDNTINVTLTHYIPKRKTWLIFSESSLFSIIYLMWECSINHSESIHTLKSVTMELNLWQISLKLTATLQNYEPKDTDRWPFVQPVLSKLACMSSKRSAAMSTLLDFMLKPAGPWMDPYFHLLIHSIVFSLYSIVGGAAGSPRPFPVSWSYTNIPIWG